MPNKLEPADAAGAALTAAPEAPLVEGASAQGAVPDAALSESTPTPSTSTEKPAETTPGKTPLAVLVIGMAGSGKTTFMQRVNAHIHETEKTAYVVNLDPAVTHVPFEPNVDIRDTVNYRQVMKQYQLGPNGGIVTSLNLFTTRFDQLLALVDKRAPTLDYVLLDTPGQIEIFTWSASGAIVTEALASAYPTVVAYLIDTPRCESPATFMSNMLYACSILYKTQLPFVLVFNKTDVVPHDFCVRWMTDFDAFQSALEESTTFMGSLVHSMCLVLEEFYENLRCVGVSSLTGAGMDELFAALAAAGDEYEREYRPVLERQRAAKAARRAEAQEVSLKRLMHDMRLGGDA